MTAIILLNWNGAQDTLDCLASLEKAGGDFRVIVADNGSTDNSVELLEQYASASPVKIDILPLGSNLGFAAGNNRAVSYAMQYSPDSFLLLNNDTVVEPDSVAELQEFAYSNPEIGILGPLICLHSDRDRIWSAGGYLTFGSRKAPLKDTRVSDLPDRDAIPVSFISGCALFVRSSLVGNDGILLSERFFFGEEDYEFALRMRNRGEKMMIVPKSVIYHKVGSSARNMTGKVVLGRNYLYYLGRLIAAKGYYPMLSFRAILFLTGLRCGRYFSASGLDRRQAGILIRRLKSDALSLDAIGYDLFRSIMIDGTYFDFLNTAAE